MKKISLTVLGISACSLVGCFSSCSSEAPFEVTGEGTVSFNTEMHSDVELTTRTFDSATKEFLEENLKIYIENNKGVIRKYLGKDNLPENLILATGDYAIEGWTGDSVSASYDKKFYRGYQEFKVSSNQTSIVQFDVNIANVIVSVDAETLDQAFDDFKVSFSHSRGLLDFDREAVEKGKKGYFMMPTSDTDLYYKVELKNEAGEDIVKEGYIRNVERAHEYSIRILTQAPVNEQGGGVVKIEVLDIPVIDKKLNVYPAPVYMAQVGAETEPFDIANIQIDFSDKSYKDVRLRIVGYGGLSKLALKFPQPFQNMEAIDGVNLKNSDSLRDAAIEFMNSHNISYEKVDKVIKVYDDAGETYAEECWITFKAQFFESLSESQEEYIIGIEATDLMPFPASSAIAIRFANTEEALDKKMVESFDAPETYSEVSPMAILAHSAELEMRVRMAEAADYGIEYRKKETGGDFTKVPANKIEIGKTGIVKITGLEADTEYEYRAYAHDFTEQNVRSFTTEAVFQIPNSSMESWVTINSTTTNAKDVPVPSLSNSVDYWDTGNHGSRSVSLAAVTLTEGSSEMKNKGEKSAKLHSQFVGMFGSLGKFAAGNIFIGEFYGVDGTDGILHLGRPYNNSHPTSLNVYVNYRPGTVDSNGAKSEYKKVGDKDEAQIYVALITGDYYEVRTKDQQKLFDEKDPQVLAYGQVTITEDFGATNQLALQNIPLKYKSAAKTSLPTRLVIVCAASKYGDYFTGGEKSTMYVDDFELQYDEIQWYE